MRHPTEIPVDVWPAAGEARRHRARNVSLGGLSFQAERPLTLGSVVNVRIASVDPSFETLARVVWCRRTSVGYELGVAFLSEDDAFRARMVEQVCHIESYRRALVREGRALSAE